MQLSLLGRSLSLARSGGRRALPASASIRDLATLDAKPASLPPAEGPQEKLPSPRSVDAATSSAAADSAGATSSTLPVAASTAPLSRRRPARALPDIFRLALDDVPPPAPRRAVSATSASSRPPPRQRSSAQTPSSSSLSASSSRKTNVAPSHRHQVEDGAASSSSKLQPTRGIIRPSADSSSTVVSDQADKTTSSSVTSTRGTLVPPISMRSPSGSTPPPPPSQKSMARDNKRPLSQKRWAANPEPYKRPVPPKLLPRQVDRPSGRSVMFKGFGPDMNKQRLQKYAELHFGRVYYVHLPDRRKSGVLHGYVTFSQAGPAEAALKQKTVTIDGEKVAILPAGDPAEHKKKLAKAVGNLQAATAQPEPDDSTTPGLNTPSRVPHQPIPTEPPRPFSTKVSQEPGLTSRSSPSVSAVPALGARPEQQPARAPHFLRSDQSTEHLQRFRPAAFPPATSVLMEESFRRAIAIFQPLYAGGRWTEKTFLEDGQERTYLVREIPREEFVEGIFEREHFERLGDWSPTVMGTLFPRWASAIQDLHNHHAEIRSNRELIRIRIISHKTYYPPTPLGSLPDPLRPPTPPQGLTTRDLHLAASIENLVRHIKEMLGQESLGL